MEQSSFISLYSESLHFLTCQTFSLFTPPRFLLWVSLFLWLSRSPRGPTSGAPGAQPRAPPAIQIRRDSSAALLCPGALRGPLGLRWRHGPRVCLSLCGRLLARDVSTRASCVLPHRRCVTRVRTSVCVIQHVTGCALAHLCFSTV